MISAGLGDTIAKITNAIGIKTCGGCEGRRQLLNQLFPYTRKEQEMIKPTKETIIPTGPEQIEYQYAGSVNLAKAGVSKTLSLTLRRFRANADGTDPTDVATAVNISLFPPKAGHEAAIAKYNAANEAAIQQLVADLGL